VAVTVRAQERQGAVVEPEQVSRVDDRGPVVGDDLPVGAVVEDLAREPRPVEPGRP
jgi:hypothetical protein